MDMPRKYIANIEEIEPSMDEWDRGYNAGLRKAVRIIKKYRENYEANHIVLKEG